MSTHAAVGSGRDLRAFYGSEVEDEAALPGERVLGREVRSCEACKKPFHPTRQWMLHCSDRCRKGMWLARQHALDFEPPVELLPPVVDQRVPPAEQRRLCRMGRQVLDILREGPICNRSLAALLPDGAAWRTRISDVKHHLKQTGETVAKHECGGGLVWRWIEAVR